MLPGASRRSGRAACRGLCAPGPPLGKPQEGESAIQVDIALAEAIRDLRGAPDERTLRLIVYGAHMNTFFACLWKRTKADPRLRRRWRRFCSLPRHIAAIHDPALRAETMARWEALDRKVRRRSEGAWTAELDGD